MRGDVVAGELEVVEVVDAERLSYEGNGWRVGGPSFKVFSSFDAVAVADNGDVVVAVVVVVVGFGCMVVLVAVGTSSSYIGLRFYVTV